MENNEFIPTMSPVEATDWLRARGMRISPETLRLGILEGQFPFGSCITGGKAPRVYVYTVMLEEWAAARYAKKEGEHEASA